MNTRRDSTKMRRIGHAGMVAALTAALAAWPYLPLSAQTPAADHAFARVPNAAGGTPAAAPKYAYLFPPPTRWQGPVRWTYNHANAPAAFADAPHAVVERIQRAFDRWTSQCGIRDAYAGATDVAPNNDATDPANPPAADGISVVGWGTLAPSLGAWAYAWYVADGDRRTIVEADVTLSIDNVRTLDDVERLMIHEWGHALGLDHSDVEAAVMAGPPATHYNGLASLQPDDLRGCRCAYGLPAGVSASYACSVPPRIDFGVAAVGTSAPAQRVTFANGGNAPLAIEAVQVDDAQFRHVDGCRPGTAVPPGAACTLELDATRPAPAPVAARLTLVSGDGPYELALAVTGTAAAPAPPAAGPPVGVVEYYHDGLDHYFMTWLPEEIARLDAETGTNAWKRTGQTFRAYAAAAPGASPACRFYIPPANGDSHFFGRDTAECEAVRRAHPDFVLESPTFMALYVSAGGACPAGTRPLYRVFNGRADTNHRYVIDRAIRDRMVADGWIAEGDGPDVIVACVPAG